jgi:hypothetical protein
MTMFIGVPKREQSETRYKIWLYWLQYISSLSRNLSTDLSHQNEDHVFQQHAMRACRFGHRAQCSISVQPHKCRDMVCKAFPCRFDMQFLNQVRCWWSVSCEMYGIVWGLVEYRQGVRRIDRWNYKRRNKLITLCSFRIALRLLYYGSLSLMGYFFCYLPEYLPR